MWESGFECAVGITIWVVMKLLEEFIEIALLMKNCTILESYEYIFQ